MGNGFIHFSNVDKNFTLVPNCVIQRSDLSCSAVGLFCRMASLPPNWNFSIKGLVKICKEGETAVCSALKELQQKGFVSIEKTYEKATGRFVYIYHLNADSPVENHVENPENGFTGSGFTSPGKPRSGAKVLAKKPTGVDQTQVYQAWETGVYNKDYNKDIIKNKVKHKRDENFAFGTRVIAFGNDTRVLNFSSNVEPTKKKTSSLKEADEGDSPSHSVESRPAQKPQIESNPFGASLKKDSRPDPFKKVMVLLKKMGCPLMHKYEVTNLHRQVKEVVSVMGKEKYGRYLDILDDFFIGKPEEKFKPTIRTAWDFTSSQKIKQVSDWVVRNGLLAKSALPSSITQSEGGSWLVNGKECLGGGYGYYIYPGIMKLYVDEDNNPIRLTKISASGEDEEWKK